MPDFLIVQGGAEISPDSILARLSGDAQRAVDERMRQWFGNDSELRGYDLDAVKELGKNAI